MTGVRAIVATRGARFWSRVGQGVLALVVVAAGGFALWYRQAYNVWPGQEASARVHWCGRDYESFGRPRQTRQQISSREHVRILPVGQYPPLGWSRQGLFAAVVIGTQRVTVSPPPLCAMVVYLRTGPDQYRAYSLEGGPLPTHSSRHLKPRKVGVQLARATSGQSRLLGSPRRLLSSFIDPRSVHFPADSAGFDSRHPLQGKCPGQIVSAKGGPGRGIGRRSGVSVSDRERLPRYRD
jgi:hypothetical protein